MKRYVILLLSLPLVFVSCHFNRTFLNEQEEKKKAEEVASDLYKLVKQKQYSRTEQLFSKRFFKATTKAKFLEIFIKTNSLLGDLESTKLIDWKTKRIEGDNPLSEYLLVYEGNYQRYKSLETISMAKEGEYIRIIGYNINSEAFLK